MHTPGVAGGGYQLDHDGIELMVMVMAVTTRRRALDVMLVYPSHAICDFLMIMMS